MVFHIFLAHFQLEGGCLFPGAVMVERAFGTVYQYWNMSCIFGFQFAGHQLEDSLAGVFIVVKGGENLAVMGISTFLYWTRLNTERVVEYALLLELHQ